MAFFKSLFEDEEEPVIWQLRDIRFDIDPSLSYFMTERVLGSALDTQDQKGNPGQRGLLLVTNLRLIWQLSGNTDVSISIGHDTVSRFQKKISFLWKNTAKYSLIVKCGKGSQKYQFKFSSFNQPVNYLAGMLSKYHEKIKDNVMYRRVQCKPTFLKDGRITLFPGEVHVSQYPAKYLTNQTTSVEGILYVSNIRVVFQSNGQPQNFSVPWICILSIKLVDNRTLKSIVLKIKSLAGLYLRTSQTQKVLTQLKRLHETYNLRPILGIEDAEQEFRAQNKGVSVLTQDVDIVQTRINILRQPKSSKPYQLNDGVVGQLDRVVFSEELGLAIEQLPEGQAVSDLWKLLG